MQEYIPFFQAEKRSIAEKLAKYFEHSGLETKIHYDEENDVYILSVPSKNEKEAKKFYQAFYFVERDRIEKEELDQSSILSNSSYEEEQQKTASNKAPLADVDEQEPSSNEISTSENDEIKSATEEVASADIDQEVLESDVVTSLDIDKQKAATDEVALTDINDLDTASAEYTASNQDDLDTNDSNADDEIHLDEDDSSSVKSLLSGPGSYVMKSEKYNDYVSTQYIFLILGVAGIIFVILNALGILTFLYGLFSNLIMGALFLSFIFVGLSTGKKARLLKLEIDEETNMTNKINDWLGNTVTKDFLESITNDTLSDELDYIKKTDTIRDMLIAEYGELDRSYLDRLIEEYYSETFDRNETYTESE